MSKIPQLTPEEENKFIAEYKKIANEFINEFKTKLDTETIEFLADIPIFTNGTDDKLPIKFLHKVVGLKNKLKSRDL